MDSPLGDWFCFQVNLLYDTSFAKLDAEQQEQRNAQLTMLFALTIGPLVDRALYGSGEVKFGDNGYDNLERYGTQGNYKGNNYSWKQPEEVPSAANDTPEMAPSSAGNDAYSEYLNAMDGLDQARKSGMSARDYAKSRGVPSSFTDEEEQYIKDDNIQMHSEGKGELPETEIKFGSEAKSTQKLQRQMDRRGWTNNSVKDTVSKYFTTRKAINRATGNPATVFYNKDGSYVIVDDITKEVVQISDKYDSNWRPDESIINPYIP